MRAWEEFLAVQEKELGSDVIQKWLRPLKLLHFDACNLYLEASDSFKLIWFEEHMRSRVIKGLYNNNHKPIKVHLSLPSPQQLELKNSAKKLAPIKKPFFPPLAFDEPSLDATFENFVFSQNHRLVQKVLYASCHSTLDFNPIYLFGRSGTGKTHLLKAASLLLKKMGKKGIYVCAEAFTQHLVNAIRSGDMENFRKAYRNVDALLIDDIEIFSKKTATQEEFFHTFNTLHVEGKQIILSSSLPPSELKFIEPRLVSRFEWGIVIPLQQPTQEELKEILLCKSNQMSFPLDEQVVSFLLETFGRNTKILLKAFDAIVLRSHLNKNNKSLLNIKTVQILLKDLIAEEEKATLTSSKIIQAVAEYYGIRITDILGKSQAREYVLPRQIAMHICREKLQFPFIKIGDIFEKDHSTVISSIKQIKKNLNNKNLEVSGPLFSILKLLGH